MILGIVVFFALLSLWMHGSQDLEKLRCILRKRPSSYILLLILILILLRDEYKIHLYDIVLLLFIPKEGNVSGEFLDILVPAILLLFLSFFVFQDFRVSINNVCSRCNINISFLKKLIIFFSSFIIFPIVKSFISSSINGTVVDIVGYPSSYFPYFEGVLFCIPLLIIFVYICFLFNSLILLIFPIYFMYDLSRSMIFLKERKKSLKLTFYGLFRILLFVAIIISNFCLVGSFEDGIKFLLSDKDGYKEIKELLLVTSYNEIPNRCNLLLDSYGKKENALLAFIDKDSVYLYIIKENKFINESCR